MVMPTYVSLLPLLENQSYISKAFVNETWLCTGSPHGDQPWLPQNSGELEWGYDKTYHLGYRFHPGIHYTGKALVDFIAGQHDFVLEEPVCPFVEGISEPPQRIIAYSFNQDYAEEKKRFWEIVKEATKLETVNVSNLPWHAAAEVINSAAAYIGCRSSNYVLAHGVAQRNIFVYEPHPHRHKDAFNNVFGNPHWHEEILPLNISPEVAACMMIDWMSKFHLRGA